MKKFNIVACIIVLLLAVASAVLSYFLYEKRVLFIDGWSQMSEAIHKSAEIVDKRDDDNPEGKESGITKFAGDLTAAKLSHKSYTKDGLAKSLKKLEEQSTEFVKQYQALKEVLANTRKELENITGQRNRMAAVFASIGSRVKAGTGNKDKFADLAGYQGQINSVSSAVDRVVSNRDAIAKEIAAIVKNNGGSLNDASLKSGNVRSALAPLNKVISDIKGQRNNYGQSLKLLASRVGVRFNDDGKPASAKVVTDAVNKRLAEVSSLQNQLSSAKRENGKLNANLKKANSDIASLKQAVAEYRRILDLKDSDADPKSWRRGSVEARCAVTGQITRVSPEYGYVVIDIGSDTTVTQKIGNKELVVNPDLEDGLSFNVVRDGSLIAVVTLTNVGEKESTANIPADKVGAINVGDKIVFVKK